MREGFCSYYPDFLFVSFFSSDSRCPNGCEVLAHGSDLHFTMTSNGDHLDLHVCIAICVSSLENCLSQVLCPFSNWVPCVNVVDL